MLVAGPARNAKGEAMIWVLRQAGSTRLYFREMGYIGPRLTAIRKEAHEFKTRREATEHPAYVFPLLFLAPEKVEKVKP